jgi:hypothetical protein
VGGHVPGDGGFGDSGGERVGDAGGRRDFVASLALGAADE